MRSAGYFCLLLTVACASRALAVTLLPDTTAPDKSMALGFDHVKDNMAFIALADQHRAGAVLPAQMAGLSYLDFAVSWSPDSRSALVGVSWAEKSKALLFFTREGSVMRLRKAIIPPAFNTFGKAIPALLLATNLPNLNNTLLERLHLRGDFAPGTQFDQVGPWINGSAIAITRKRTILIPDEQGNKTRWELVCPYTISFQGGKTQVRITQTPYLRKGAL